MERNRLLSDSATGDYRRNTESRGNLAVALSGEFQTPVPDALRPFHLASPQEKRRRVRAVLVDAWRHYRQGKLSMVDSINAASDTRDGAGEHAKISLRRILLELNLTAWETHPARSRDDVHALFRKAIGKLTPHRGGWVVAR